MVNRRWMVAAAIGSALLVTAVAVKSRDYLSGLKPGPDAGAYTSAGMMIVEGRVPYRDFNHSAPAVAFLDAIALKLGDGSYQSVRALEVAFAIAGAWLALMLAWRITSRLDVATILALLFILLSSSNWLVEEGNATEEFGSVFALAGVLAAIESRHAIDGTRRRALLLLMSGVAFGLAVLSKEPFIYSAVPWLVFAAMPIAGAWREATKRAAVFVGGTALVGGAFLLYLGAHGALSAWADSIAIAIGYAGTSGAKTIGERHAALLAKLAATVFGASRVGLALVLAGTAASLGSAWRKGEWPLRALGLTACAGFVFEYWGASTSGRPYGHYFLQTLPSYFVLACCGAAMLGAVVERRVHRRLWPVVLALLFIGDVASTRDFRRQLTYQRTRAPISAVSTFMRTHRVAGDRLWSPSLFNSRFYVETGMTSPVSYHFIDPVLFQDTRFRTRAERLTRLASEVEGSAPAWIVLQGLFTDPMAEAGLSYWVCLNYRRLSVSDAGGFTVANLYARSDRAAVVGQRGDVDPLCDPLRAHLAAAAKR